MEHTGPRPWMVAVTGRACKEAAGGVSGAGETAKIPWGTGRCSREHLALTNSLQGLTIRLQQAGAGHGPGAKLAEGAATAMKWLGVLKGLTAVVRSTLREAVAEAATVERTVQDGEVQRPVTGEARTGEAKADRVVSATGFTEADGVSECDDAEGGEPSETTRRARQAVRPRSAAAKGHDVRGRRGKACAP